LGYNRLKNTFYDSAVCWYFSYKLNKNRDLDIFKNGCSIHHQKIDYITYMKMDESSVSLTHHKSLQTSMHTNIYVVMIDKKIKHAVVTFKVQNLPISKQ
jgi:hypothetical protein